ncbi:conserved protein of unknown function [Pseudodesulfovibrio profundus]|uniref:Transmembrane protein n=1 Tax=Pseudodesulfovibrio profundus TaxID=57320 RepID=A0A2C8FB95_9BACT|nr:hypothetical protein [Pseudodesulfovibrio profundus]SOB60050.1 conserved protein of unknown function [Pseudodesulfovibrio profundus]
MKKEKKDKESKKLKRMLGSLAEPRDNAIRIKGKTKEQKMETILMIFPAAYFAFLIGIAVFFGGGESCRTITNGRRKEEGSAELFNDITDPAKSYLIQNIHHDNSDMEDNSFDWDDSSSMDSMSSTSMWDD